MALVLDGNGTMTVGNGDITGLVAGALPSTVIGAGAVLQVVANTTATQTNTTTSTYADTTVIASITPSSATSKVLVTVYCGQCVKPASDTQLNIQLFRGASGIFLAAALNNNGAVVAVTNPTLVYLDSPATTASTTYKIQISNRDSAGTINFNNNGTATITLMEIAA